MKRAIASMTALEIQPGQEIGTSAGRIGVIASVNLKRPPECRTNVVYLVTSDKREFELNASQLVYLLEEIL